MSDKDIINQIKNLEKISLEQATKKFNDFSSSAVAQKYVDILSKDPEGERFDSAADKIPDLVRRAVDAGASFRDIASILKIEEADARKLMGVSPSVIKQGPDIPYGREFDDPSRPLAIDRPDFTLTDLMSQSRPSVSVPNVNVDRPDVTLTDLMSQSRPSVSVPNIPSAGSSQGYNPYTQGIDLGRQQPASPVPDPTAEVLAPIRKEISPMGTYGMTREEFEAARGPRIGDVKRSDLQRPDLVSSDLPDDIQEMVKKVIAKRTPTEQAPEYESSLPPEIREMVVEQIKRKNEKAKGFAREFAAGATLETADELEAFVNSLEKGTSYSVEKERINKEREEYTYLNPGAGVAAEGLGILPGAALSSLAMTKAGITGIPAQSTIDAGTYGFMSGESVEERLIYGAGGAATGYVTGRVLDSIFKPSLPQKSTNTEALHTQQTNELQQSLSAQKVVVRPDAQLTDDEVVDQLIIRETEFLADALGRQGVDPNKLGNFNIRLLNFGSEMGVSNKQLNKIVSKNKRIKQLRKDSTRGFVDVDDLNAYRRDLLDNVAGRFALDVNKTIPAAQSTVVKLRRLGSPLATLAETVVGKAFADRIVRGMNRVVRGQSELDQIWKGMEDLRTLADDVAFNDMMLDAVNAQRLGAKAAQSALNRAKAYANKKIGEGAGDRLQRFLDDNVAFNQRYRRDVTKGVLSDIWMHSAVRSTDDDVSLRVNRARAASKAEDDASKARKRRAMAKEREKPEGEQLEYANIFDSHWRWQRETLTRMELGKQLGLRTSGAPLVAPNIKDLPKALRKKVEEGEMTPIEALAKIETDSFKLFDEKIIREALEAEGLSDVQIKNAVEILDDLGVNANRGMAQELEIVRSLGYVGTIANPYGALMNIHDLFNASFELGVGNVLKAVFSRNGIKFSAEDVGLGQQVFGDFVRRANKGDPSLGSPFLKKIADASEDLLRWSMKASGFAGLDKFGKGRIMGASFNKAKQDIRAGSFDEKWKHSFSRGELDQLKRDIAANNVDSELVRDLVMFDLFRLQPINAAAQTSFGLANPNARLFYMLKGFAIKQFDLMERRIIREWQQGNKKEALTNAMKYLVLSGGGYGVVNEARQVIKGEAPDPKEAAYGALYQIGSVLTLGAMGANDYGYAKFMEDPLHATVLNFMPPVGATLPAAVLEDVSDAVRKGDPLPDETIYALPIVGKTLKGVFGD
jgi:uncharacterized protein (DUF2267 family)